MQQFTLTLKDTTQKAFNSFFWFLYFLHLTAASVIIINAQLQLQKILAIAVFTGFFILTAIFYLFKNKIRLYNYQLATFLMMVVFWLLQSAWLPAVIVALVIIFALLLLKTKSVAVFTAQNIIITKSFFKKNYSWGDADNVVLKDHLLSVDFKNNRLMQIEIAPESFNVDEAAFNQFCHFQLKTVNPKL